MRSDRIVAVILLLMGVFVFMEGLSIPRAALQREPGAGAFPMLLGVLMSVLAVALFVSAGRKRKAPVRPPAPAEAVEKARAVQEPLPARLKRIGWVALTLAVYFILLKILGFLAASVLFGVIYLYLIYRQRILSSLFTAVLLAAFGFLLFEVLLKVPLPEFLESIK
ncbi:MAG: tripartite tricarboxylate transporter TctB family protein [Bacillota bacterium]